MSQSITDKGGRQFALDLTIGTALRIQKETGLNLLADTSFLDEKPGGMAAALPALEADPLQLALVLYAACEPEATARKIDRDMFLMAWDGPTLKTAYKNLCEAVCDFFPDRADRIRKMAAAIGEGREKASEAQNRLSEAAAQVIGAIDVEALVAQALSGAAPKTTGSMSGSLLAASA